MSQEKRSFKLIAILFNVIFMHWKTSITLDGQHFNDNSKTEP